jgi:hypothetical protein
MSDSQVHVAIRSCSWESGPAAFKIRATYALFCATAIKTICIFVSALYHKVALTFSTGPAPPRRRRGAALGGGTRVSSF